MLFNALFVVVSVVILAAFFTLLVSILSQWRKNRNSPRLTANATVVTKRSSTSLSQTPIGGDITGAHGFSTSSSTTYYVTFQFESGERTELCVPASDYGLLAEGDRGRLTFQGTRYLGFERQPSKF